MRRETCVCGCGKRRGLHRHHIIYQQEIRNVVRSVLRDEKERTSRMGALLADRRNIVMLAFRCHGAHHNRTEVLSLEKLPDSAFEFASELLGPEAAYVYLRRRYAGDDARLDRLLKEDPDFPGCFF